MSIKVPDISTLKSYFDELEETRGDDECRAWLNKIVAARRELAVFVAKRRGRGDATEVVGFLKGSFNFGYRVRFRDDGPDAFIRFPKPGHTLASLRDEKVTNEVQVMECLREQTTIPVPRIISWGLTQDSPQRLGPFIIMDFVEGVLLSSILRKKPHDESEELLLDFGVDQKLLGKVYKQIASYLHQLSQLKFARIGAISKETGEWSVTKRALTYNMNELATVSGYSPNNFPTSPFESTSEYCKSLAHEHMVHLETQRNIAEDEETAKARFLARKRFPELIPKYCIDDSGPFLLFCDDLRPSNMLVNPETLEITAVLDWEFTNAMPAPFSYDPPWWLLLSGPDAWLERDALATFNALYEPTMEHFLTALAQVEEVAGAGREAEPMGQRLSARMRESWRSARFWFNYAARKSFDIDLVYWAALHEGPVTEALDDELRNEMEMFAKSKMTQLQAYRAECTVRFSKPDS